MPSEVKMPQLGMNQDSAIIVSWLKAAGDKVVSGDPIFEVETDKATVEVEAQAEGYLAGIRAGKGTSVPVGDVIALIVESEAEVTKHTAAPVKTEPTPEPEKPPAPVTGRRPLPISSVPAGKVLASPKAKRLAFERGIDLLGLRAQGMTEPIHAADIMHFDQVSETDVIASPSVRKIAAENGIDVNALARRLGRRTIGREDVLRGASGAERAPSPNAAARYWDVDHSEWGPVTEEPLNRTAEVAVAILTAAQQLIPSVTHHDSADVTRIESLRNKLKSEGSRITALAFHVAALARCLKDYPRFNASLSVDGKRLILKRYVHIGIAVDTDRGLMVPVIRDADLLRIPEISKALADIAARARARKLRPHEMGGASMTISNLGGIGGEAFTPIVNPPELAILGLTRTEIRPVWNGSDFFPTPTVPLDLTYDHRAVNGADAARFLVRYRDILKHPETLPL